MNGGTDAPVLLNEGPEVVSAMALVLGNGGSLETAVRGVAEDGPEVSRRLFSEIVAKADTREDPDMRTALSRVLTDLPQDASAYSMAVRMMMSAASSRDAADRDRLMAEARRISLDGLREAGRTYSSGLNAPCMMIFGIGIMVPMVLMSVLPMLSASGMFEGAGLDTAVISLITLVLIPAAMCAMVAGMRSRNPFRRTSRAPFDLRAVLPMLSAAPLFLVSCMVLEAGAQTSFCISVVIASAATLALSSPGFGRERRRTRQEKVLKESVFDMGNYLLSGTPYEEAFRSAVLPRGECGDVVRSYSTEMGLCRGDCVQAVRNALSPVSESMAGLYAEIYSASLKDVRESGRLALSLGRQMMDQDSIRSAIRSDLKGMTDTMTGTAAVFAPLVLGLSITILGPMSRLSAGLDLSGTAWIISVYLVELSAVISMVLSFVDGDGGLNGILRRFVTLLPVSLTVFLLVSLVSI